MNAPARFAVVARNQNLADTFTLELRPSDHSAPPAFQPGQFNMLYAFGAGEVPISHCGDPGETASYSHTIRSVGLTTASLQRLQVGDELGVRGPFGRGWPMDRLAGKHLLIVAGGLGLVPLRPLLCLAADGALSLQGAQLFYGSRSPATLLYADQLRQWGERMPVEVSVDQGDSRWRGSIGVITNSLERADFPRASTVACLCGPEIMMRFSVRTLLGMGLPPDAIYLSMERNMHCAVGHCGHCQWGPHFVCRDGPVFRFADIETWFYRREI